MHATMAIFNAWCDRMPRDPARRDRPGRCRAAPAVDRLDPHRARPGRAGPRLHQVGRPAGLAGRRARIDLSRAHGSRRPRRRARSTSTSTSPCRKRSSTQPLPAARRRALSAAASRPALARRRSRSSRRCCADAQAAGDARWAACRAASTLERAHRARRDAQCARAHRSEGRRGVSDAIIRCMPARPASTPCPKRATAIARGRRDPQPRLGRSRRHAAARVRRRDAAARRSSRSRRTISCTTAGAWTTRGCRRSTSCWPPSPTRRRRADRRDQLRAEPRAGAARLRRRADAGAGRARSGPLDDGASGRRPARSRRRARRRRFVHLPLGWDGGFWHFRHPLDFLGSDGGGGIGGGPGITVGAALALKGSGRLPICIGGDGDFLMGATAFWTAAHYRIPLLYHRRQQPLVLQRRGAPGARRADARPAGREQLDRPAHRRSGARHRGDRRARRARSASARSRAPTSSSPHCAKRSRMSMQAASPSSTCHEPGYTPAMAASLNHATATEKK